MTKTALDVKKLKLVCIKSFFGRWQCLQGKPVLNLFDLRFSLFTYYGNVLENREIQSKWVSNQYNHILILSHNILVGFWP